MSNVPSTAPGSSAEVQAAAFAADDRIHFSKETNTWRFEQEDGTELEYDATKGTWVPLVGVLQATPRTWCHDFLPPGG